MSKEIQIKGHVFNMGDQYQEGVPFDRESPVCEVEIQDFMICDTPVTNAEFQKFIVETGYVTDAEKFGWSSVFYLLIPEIHRGEYTMLGRTPWWLAVEGAKWDKPEGPSSNIVDRMDHPVVHVSRNDALAYCKWAGMRLPTEAEWEFAARGGNTQRFPWGDELEPNGQFMANTWQGDFPNENTQKDGYLGTAPVYTYSANNYGLYQMIGNVWEWCSNPSGISLNTFNIKSAEDFWKENETYSDSEYAIRGGSFLCHASYCNRYRVAARNANTASSTSSNLGFRCVKN
ncbi:formylglycine-generating enzyme family protein [Aerococcaceae bacterium NML190938]|nr:formylglycine-generating enzyme family protein [Aerococcaceae bacterium NML190938]